MFLETSVERPPVCCSPVLLCLWLLICAVMVFWVLCPVQACYVPRNQCWETSCLLQSRPVVPMASDLCRHGVLSVVSCSGLLCSSKPVLRDLLSAAIPSCCAYGFWSVPSWCFECCVLFRPVMFLETSVEGLLSAAVPSCCAYGFWSVPPWCFECCVLFRPVMFLETSVEKPPVCCSPVLLCLWLLIRASWCFQFYVLFRPVVFLETIVERPPVCCSPVLWCLWLLIRAVMVCSVLCPVPACFVPGNQCWETSCLLQSRPVVPMASDLCRHGVFSVVSCSGLLCS